MSPFSQVVQVLLWSARLMKRPSRLPGETQSYRFHLFDMQLQINRGRLAI